MSESKLNEKGIEKYPISRVIIGNIMMLLWLVVGTIAVWFFSPVLAVIYLFVALVVIYIILRKLVCTNCYYYDKWCSMGWGKLAAALFKQGKIEQFNESVGIKLAPIIYGLLTIVPFIVLIFSILALVDFYKIGTFVILLFFAVYSAGLGRKAACQSCKMNTYCKGTVAKS